MPCDAELTEVVGAPQVENLLLDVSGRTKLRVQRAWPAVDEGALAVRRFIHFRPELRPSACGQEGAAPAA